MMGIRAAGSFVCALVFIYGSYTAAGWAQEAEVADDTPEAEQIEQLMIDLDALIIGTTASLRCPLYDSTIQYLSPLHVVAATFRIRQIEAALAEVVEDLPDQIAEMRAEAATIECGNEGLEPFIAFNAQVAQDLTDVALFAWRTLPVGQCVFVIDDGFRAAVARARGAGAALVLDEETPRAAYIRENAAFWQNLFVNNCFNLGFDPVETLPGQIALALPAS